MALVSLRRLTKGELSEMTGKSLPTIESWIRRGMPVEQRGARGIPWEIDPWQVAEWYFTRQSGGGSEAVIGAASSLDPDELAPKDRLDWYRGEAEKRKLAVQDGQLIPAGDVEVEMRSLFSTFVGFLATLPDILERDAGITGEGAERVQVVIDEARDRLYSVIGE